jgi:endonuclease G
MGRTTAIIVLIAIVTLLLIGGVALGLIGDHLVASGAVGSRTAPANASASGAGTSATPSGRPAEAPGDAAPGAPGGATASASASADASAWQPQPTSTLLLKPLTYRYFSIGYDEQARNPAWVVYRLAGPIIHHGHEHRPATFATEFRTAAQVAHQDYNGSGFDRGHMCPAYALFSRFGDEGLQTTFTMANVIPQYHDLNAGAWEHLEEAIAGRDGHGDGWAASDGPLWIINGPVYDTRPASAMLRNRTWVPRACFSVILRQLDGHWDALAVEMPNLVRVTGPWMRYLTAIGTIERETRIDLLAGLPAPERERLERERASTGWR